MEETNKKMCKCPHHNMTAAMLIVIGLVVITGVFKILSAEIQTVILGLAILMIGVGKIGGRKCTCCDHDKVCK